MEQGGFPFPFALDPATGGIRLTDESRDVREAVRIILMTEQGERPMLPAFGARLNRFAFERMDNTTRSLIRQEVISALLAWEDRIENITVEFEGREREGILLVQVSYQLKSDGSRAQVELSLSSS